MTFKRKASLLVGTIALASAAYLPAASAATFNLGNISVPTTASSQKDLSAVVATGSFTETYNFSLSKAADVSASFGSNSQSQTFSGLFNASAGTGVTLNNVALYAGSKEIASITATGISSAPNVISLYGGQIQESLTATTYSALLSQVLKANTAYSLVVTGNNLGNVAGNISGSLSALAAPVPEPEEWAMMLVGTGLVGYQVRRKQKGLSHSNLA